MTRPTNGRAPAGTRGGRGTKSTTRSVAYPTDRREIESAIARFRETHSIADTLGIDNPGRAELNMPCPLCGGRDRLVIRLNENRACRQCERSGDALLWAMLLDGIDPSTPGATARYLRERGFFNDTGAAAKNGHTASKTGQRKGFESARQAAEWAAKRERGTVVGLWF